ncbi:MAG: hypothetical protein KDD50_14445, partial [Bdellovibrionales bacterium]|nr:hypothetical protein [Bdellovibrionales bacterium]
KNFLILYENFEVLKNVITESIHEIINIIGELSEGCPEIEECRENYLTFILTNGSTMIGYHGGQQLYYSIHKSKCGESASCPFYSSVCENEQISGKVNHLVLSSEPVNGENEWRSLKMGQFIAVDDQMNIHKSWIE